MKKWRHVALVVGIVVLLAAAVAALALANRSDVVVEPGSVAVTQGGKTLKVFTMAQVKALPSVTANKTIVSSNHGNEKGAFTGVPVRRLLDEVRPSLLGSAKLIVTRATDGYVSSLDAEEISGSDDVLLAYAKDGQSLGTSSDGGTGPFRIVILSDKFGNRCTKWVNEIEVQ